MKLNDQNDRAGEFRACPVPGCDRDDLRGQIGLSMHQLRAHSGKNWQGYKRGKPDKGTPLPKAASKP